MMTPEENERLARVGPGTPMGNMLRRYWHPIAGVEEMANRWTMRVRLLGEDLVLFKDRSGRLGLIAEACPHRRASLAYGIPQADGIRCPYHGWKFDRTGQCLDQPNEPEGSSFKDKITTAGYPVEELGGLIFAYLGPQPAPLVPRFDGYVIPGTIRMCGKAIVPCNWLQIMENSLDPVHTEWLHGHLQEFIEEEAGAKYAISRHHVNIGFDEFEYGIYKRRLLEGQSENSDDWRVGHPVVFPTTLAVGGGGGLWTMYSFQIRTPIDDENTLHLWYIALEPPKNAVVPAKMLDAVPIYDVPFRDEKGEYILDMIDAQDVMAWASQGRIARRELEKLGSSDRGVTLLRRVLQREMKKVEAGQDPIGVIRDPERNRIIELPVEKDKDMFSDGFASVFNRFQGRYYPYYPELLEVFASANPKPKPEKRDLTPVG